MKPYLFLWHVGRPRTNHSFLFYFLGSCLPVIGVITPRGMFFCSVVLEREKKKRKEREGFKSVKLGVQIIQVEVEAILAVLDSELFSRRYIQTALHASSPRWEPRV